jgi:hypothetical protein
MERGPPQPEGGRPLRVGHWCTAPLWQELHGRCNSAHVQLVATSPGSRGVRALIYTTQPTETGSTWAKVFSQHAEFDTSSAAVAAAPAAAAAAGGDGGAGPSHASGASRSAFSPVSWVVMSKQACDSNNAGSRSTRTRLRTPRQAAAAAAAAATATGDEGLSFRTLLALTEVEGQGAMSHAIQHDNKCWSLDNRPAVMVLVNKLFDKLSCRWVKLMLCSVAGQPACTGCIEVAATYPECMHTQVWANCITLCQQPCTQPCE